jgi:ethanolamine utilization microcompartment shell protein EutL
MASEDAAIKKARIEVVRRRGMSGGEGCPSYGTVKILLRALNNN